MATAGYALPTSQNNAKLVIYILSIVNSYIQVVEVEMALVFSLCVVLASATQAQHMQHYNDLYGENYLNDILQPKALDRFYIFFFCFPTYVLASAPLLSSESLLRYHPHATSVL